MSNYYLEIAEKTKKLRAFELSPTDISCENGFKLIHVRSCSQLRDEFNKRGKFESEGNVETALKKTINELEVRVNVHKSFM